MSSDETCRACGSGRANRVKTSEILHMWSLLPTLDELEALDRIMNNDHDAQDNYTIRQFMLRIRLNVGEIVARKAALEGRPNSVQIQARIPEDIAKVMIDRALADGRSLSAIVRELIERGLQSRPEP